jgi:parvulin-like peptidyl-prolyl isomerase
MFSLRTAASLSAACSLVAAAPTALARETVARMGSVALSTAELQTLLDSQPPELHRAILASPAALEQTIRADIVRRAVAADAQARGWDKRPDVALRVNAAREEVIATTYVIEITKPPADYPPAAEVETYYEENRARLVSPKRYRLAQIHVARPADKAAAHDAVQKAGELAARAKVPDADFAALARAGSGHASAASGGDAGWVAESAMIPPVRQAVARMTKGQVSDLIATGDGWQVIKLVDVAEPGPATLDEARPQIVAALRRERAQQLERQYLDALLARTPVVIDKAALEKLR